VAFIGFSSQANLLIGAAAGTRPEPCIWVGQARGEIGQIFALESSRLSGADITPLTTPVQQTNSEIFPAETLAVQWAYFGKRILLNGKAEPAAELAEIWLPANHRDSFGEYPPRENGID